MFPKTELKQAVKSSRFKILEDNCVYTITWYGKTKVYEIVYCEDEGTVTGYTPELDFEWPDEKP